jgi:hypothetical protein
MGGGFMKDTAEMALGGMKNIPWFMNTGRAIQALLSKVLPQEL